MESRACRQNLRPHAVQRTVLIVIIISLFLCALSTSRRVPHGAYAQEARRAEGGESVREITPGESVQDELGAPGSRLFKLKLTAGQYVRAEVEKGDFNLSVALLSGDGRTLLATHTSRRFGPLRFSFIVESTGDVYFQLSSLEQEPAPRPYRLRIESVRNATASDREEAAASRAYAEAESSRANWDQQSISAAIAKYTEAAAAWERVGERREQLRALRSIGECRFILSQYREALEAYNETLSVSRRMKDGAAEMDALNDIGYVYIYLGDNTKALPYFKRVLSSLDGRRAEQGVETQRRRAQALNNAGEVYYSLSQLRTALTQFELALAAWRRAGDRSGEALGHLNLGYTYTDLGNLEKASGHYERALALWQAVGDSRGAALTLTAIGGLQTFLGEKQSALDYHHRAMRIFLALGNYQGEAAAANGMGQVYEDLNQPEAALDSYRNALQLYERIGNRDFSALSQYYVGRVYQRMGDAARAQENYEQSVQLSHEVGDRQVEAHALKGVGAIFESYGQRERALEQYAQALKLYERIGDRRGQAQTLNSIGYLHHTAGDERKAVGYYAQALSLTRAVEDRREEVSSLYNMAHAERDSGNLNEALEHISAAIELIESLRLKVVGEQLRTSYFASVHKHYELYIDLLMRKHKEQPGAGFAAMALQASERARARSLLETFIEQRVRTISGGAQDLPARERLLWQQLSFRLEAQTRLLNGKHTEAEAAEGAREIRSLMSAYQEVLDRIREESPVYATLTQAQLLHAEDIMAAAHADTVMLEYALGDEQSYLWVVTAGSLEGYELPPRATIEGLAREVYDLMTARQPVEGEQPAEYSRRVEAAEAGYWPRAAELSRMLLGKVAPKLAGKRLLIICDGLLHRIPFDALPEPDAVSNVGVVPLVVGHEVVTVPSASVLSALRNERRANAAPSQLIAVLADPVFDTYDSRLNVPRETQTAGDFATTEPDLYQAMRDAGEVGSENPLPRLSSSLREAQAIEDLTPSGVRMISTGFDANLERVTGGELDNFRIIHFATHAIFDDEHPALSGLVLSRVDQSGRRRDGFLRAEDVYNLHLKADLVVLSACRTGLGPHVNGEGILGITRAFLCAGAHSVIASMWKVNDEATAELMKHFYSAMLKDGLPPSAALRAAKAAILKQERWRSPYFWAGFVMQGEFDRPPVAVSGGHKSSRLHLSAIVLLLPAVAVAVLLALRAARRLSAHHL